MWNTYNKINFIASDSAINIVKGIKLLEINCNKLQQDVSTRFKSTFIMLTSLINNKEALNYFF